MQKQILLLAVLLTFSIQIKAIEVAVDKWSFFKENEYCYIINAPSKKEGDYKVRGETYVLVYRINKSPNMIVQVIAGYNYNEKKPVIVKIDQTSFQFSNIDEDAAFIDKKDKEVIFAMKKGKKMVIQGHSSRGTLTTDTYTLLGFTNAVNKLSKDC